MARLHSLDALRGVAALSVVLFHWQHFWLLGGRTATWPPPAPIDHSKEPFFPVLRLFYEQGFWAVDLFFVISGFVFFWLYQQKLAAKTMSPATFGALRFSRLYPLHLATLVFIALAQLAFARLSGGSFVYPANDAPHFVAAIFFLQGDDAAAAFNGPEWSLTVEIAMYVLFCALAARGLLRRPWLSCALVIVGVALSNINDDVARGLSGFFVGGLTFMAFSAAGSRAVSVVAAIIAMLGWALVLTDVYSGGAISSAFVGVTKPLFGDHLYRAHYALRLIVLYGLFPVTVLAIALSEATFSVRYGAVAWLGEISYSSYLLHFPLQLLMALLVVGGALSLGVARSGLGMAAYFAILVPLSLVVYRRFEVPMQSALRRAWSRSIATPESKTPPPAEARGSV